MNDFWEWAFLFGPKYEDAPEFFPEARIEIHEGPIPPFDEEEQEEDNEEEYERR